MDHTAEFETWSADGILTDDAGVPLVVWHGTTEVVRHGAQLAPGCPIARRELQALCECIGMPAERWTDVSSVVNRWVQSQKDIAQRYGIDEQIAANAAQWSIQARSKVVREPWAELRFELFELPGGGKELGAHFGTKEQASVFGDPFAFLLRLNNPVRLPDLGTWDYQLVMRELRRARVAISEQEYDQVFNARFGGENQALRDLLMAKGIDGIVYENEAEGRGDSYIVLDPANVWSLSQRPVDLVQQTIHQQPPLGWTARQRSG
jgi:hypothetical protein